MQPLPLKKGDTIGLIAPSSPPQPGRVEAGIHYLSQLGFKTQVGKYLTKSDRFLAGTDQERAADIMTFFEDTSINAIMAIAGGYGSQRVLPYLDMEIIQQNPKLLTGFSDTTALQIGLHKKTRLVSYSGFTFRDVDKPQVDSLIERSLKAALMRQSITITEGRCIHPGRVTAPLLGGNLECLIALMGTPYQPDFRDVILLIEDVFAEPFQTDARLSQLQLAGVFDQVSGVIFGLFEQCIARHNPERDGTIEEVIAEWSQRINVPTIIGFPYGHCDRRCVMPIGKEITMQVSQHSSTVVL